MGDEFLDYKSNPASDTLIRLLRAHQDRVYRLCLQVLRRPHDAEDAAQEVLLKLVDAARSFDDAGAFRRWAYRVSLNAALESARKASRRRVHESRAAMKELPPAPLDDESRRALFEGMAKLDDGPRALLLDHYFEGETLESLGAREGVSPQAVSKRIDRARDDLKRALPATFLGAPDLGRLFERGISAPVAPDLVSGPVLAKAATVAGGIAMITKSTVLTAVIITAIVCLSAGTGFGVLLNSRADGPAVERAEIPGIRRAVATPPGVSAPPDRDRPAPAPRVGADKPEAKPAVSPLTVRLDLFKDWKKASRREVKDLIERGAHGEIPALQQRKWREEVKVLEGLSALAFAEPGVFLAFLRDPENETYFESFVIKALGFARLDHPVHITNRPQAFDDFPAALVEGLLDLTKTGSETQRSEAFGFFSRLTGLPAEYADHFKNLIHDPNPEIQVSAINVMTGLGPATGETVRTLIDLGSGSHHEIVRSRVAAALEHVDQPEAVSYLFERLEAPRDPREMVAVTKALSFKIMVASRIGGRTDVSSDRFLSAVSAQWGRGYDEVSFKAVVSYLLECPGDKVRGVLNEGLAAAPTSKSRVVLGEILQRWDDGEKDREVFKKMLYSR